MLGRGALGCLVEPAAGEGKVLPLRKPKTPLLGEDLEVKMRRTQLPPAGSIPWGSEGWQSPQTTPVGIDRVMQARLHMHAHTHTMCLHTKAIKVHTYWALANPGTLHRTWCYFLIVLYFLLPTPLILATVLWGRHFYLHFPHEGTEAKSYLSIPDSPSWQVAKLGCEPSSLVPESVFLTSILCNLYHLELSVTTSYQKPQFAVAETQNFILFC